MFLVDISFAEGRQRQRQRPQHLKFSKNVFLRKGYPSTDKFLEQSGLRRKAPPPRLSPKFTLEMF